MRSIYLFPVVATILLSSCGISIGGQDGFNVTKDSVNIGGKDGFKADGLDKIQVQIDPNSVKVGGENGLTLDQSGIKVGNNIKISESSGGTQVNMNSGDNQ